MDRRALALLTVWALTLSAATPRGWDGSRVAHAEPSQDAARAHFLTGVAQAKRHDWASALQSFDAAYRLAPEPAVLFNLAGAQNRCGKLLASNTNYRRLLASGDDRRLSRVHRLAIEQQIARIERRMPRLRIHIEGLRSDDRVLLDQARLYADELDRDMWVDPGTHQLRVIRARGHPENRTIVLAESELRTVALGLP